MSQMQRPNPFDPAHKVFGAEPPDPKEKLKQLQIELNEQTARLAHLNQERTDLQTDIGDLQKSVTDMQTALTDYAGTVKDFETRLHTLQYFYDQKHKMVMAAIGDKRGPIDELVAGLDYEIEKMRERLEELGEKRAGAGEESKLADAAQAEKQSRYDEVKSYKTVTDGKLTDMESLSTAIKAADDATDIASMYLEVVEFERVLSDTKIISQHQVAQELKQRLGELETAKEHARARSAAWNELKTEYDTHQAKLTAKIDGRRAELLAAVQALYPVPHASTTAAGAAGSAAASTSASTSGSASPAAPAK
jgi:chromosome segregation ATPase